MNILPMLFYILLFVAIFYFLAVRPQRRQKTQHAAMMRAMKKGDEIVTVGGLYGTVRKIGDDWVEVEIAPRTRVKFLKRAISTITTVPEEDEYVEEEEYEDAEAPGELEAGDEADYADEELSDEDEEAYDEGDEEEAYAEDAEEEPVAAEEPVAEQPQKSGSRSARRRK